MNTNSESHVAGEESDKPDTRQTCDDPRERDRRVWLWAWIILGMLICFAPGLSSLLAMGFALILGCDSISFNEQHVPLCSMGQSSQIYALGFIGHYGWVFSAPAGILVLLFALIGYAANDKS